MTAALEGRAAVVTGGGRGVGAAVGRALAADGASVLLAARSFDQADAVAGEIRDAGGSAQAARSDVSNPDDVAELGRLAADMFGSVAILVNNAGAAFSAPVHKTPLAEWERLFAVNARGAFLCTQAFLPGMLARGWGRIVNVASTAGLHGDRYIAAYAASKHAMLGLTRSVAAEVAAKGVTVNAVCPGYLDTDMTRESLDRIVALTGREREAALDTILAANPQGRLIDPADVAATVLFLCREEAASINGAAIVLDGGQLRR